MTDADDDTRLVEYACRHRDIVTKPLYSDWIGTLSVCDVCDQHRKIVWWSLDV